MSEGIYLTTVTKLSSWLHLSCCIQTKPLDTRRLSCCGRWDTPRTWSVGPICPTNVRWNHIRPPDTYGSQLAEIEVEVEIFLILPQCWRCPSSVLQAWCWPSCQPRPRSLSHWRPWRPRPSYQSHGHSSSSPDLWSVFLLRVCLVLYLPVGMERINYILLLYKLDHWLDIKYSFNVIIQSDLQLYITRNR